MATKRPKVDLKPIGKLIEAKMKELKVLHDSGKLTNRQMAKVKIGHLPKLKILLFATEKICSEHPWEEHGHDPDEDPAAAYYTAWVTALERVLAEHGVTA